MASNIYIYSLFYLFIYFTSTNGFIPQPIIADGGQSSDSITHTEITQLGFIRTLCRYLYDTRIVPNKNNTVNANPQDYFAKQHTIDDCYKLAHPEYSDAQVTLYTGPMKFVLDLVMTHNALVDFDPKTKKLSSAHCDSEAFPNCSRRIIQLKKTVVDDVRNNKTDLTNAHTSLGQLLHTLQDFYSHSNWVELNKTDVNILIGQNETIGTVAAPDQATCTNNGCVTKTQDCSIWQRITLRKCPLVYYDCTNNILPEIINKQILTSGYLLDQMTDSNGIISKPLNLSKCSHGSVSDESTSIPAIGGINKDSTNLIFSPHANLHFIAVEYAINATERFLNGLRATDLGDEGFGHLFLIDPTDIAAKAVADEVAKGKRFRFFTPLVTASLNKSTGFLMDLKNTLSGYLLDQMTDSNGIISKPLNLSKCSHGSVSDESTSIPAIGGINKDSTNLIFSPHANLHFIAVEYAINATERFLNGLRATDLGDEGFGRLFLIDPTDIAAKAVADEVAKGKRFRFFTPLVTASLNKSTSFLMDLKNTLTKTINSITSIFNNIFPSGKANIPTFDLSDLGINIEDMSNSDAAPYLFASKNTGRKKRLIDGLRQKQKINK
ncbi:unnamed protein product [Adineta steineri]|uniref:VWA7 N-terminal domain-containing protein n=1 Tax=Adineta steineri TaxID=433720 RepID=A0A814DQ18_9BILA|nr:unnamed protein product [Adineta steineri]